MNEPVERPRLQMPFTGIFCGPTSSGKTEKVAELIRNMEHYLSHKPEEIVICYGSWQNVFEDISNNNMGIPVRTLNEFTDVKEFIPVDRKHRLLIIDDLMAETKGSIQLDNLFTKHSHHMNISVIYITQNIFSKGARQITLNGHYFLFMKSPRNVGSIENFGKQIGRARFLKDAFADATRYPYSGLLLDMKQNTDERLRVIGNFFEYGNTERPMEIYVEKRL